MLKKTHLALISSLLIFSIISAKEMDDSTSNKTYEGIITFNSDRDGNSEIYIANSYGSEQTNITNNPANDAFGVWSPDGLKIAFVSDRSGEFGIYIMDLIDLRKAEFSEPYKIVNMRPSSRIAWSADGKRILFDAWPECDIFVVNCDGSELTKITNTSTCEFQPQFSPDGNKIIFCLTADEKQNICIMNSDGRDIIQLTDDGVSYFPAWSPDGKKIAFNSSRSGRQDVDICVMDIDGSNRKWLTNHYRHDEFPAWSKDSKYILYQSDRGTSQIFMIKADGTNNRLILGDKSYNNSAPNFRD